MTDREWIRAMFPEMPEWMIGPLAKVLCKRMDFRQETDKSCGQHIAGKTCTSVNIDDAFQRRN